MIGGMNLNQPIQLGVFTCSPDRFYKPILVAIKQILSPEEGGIPKDMGKNAGSLLLGIKI